MRNPTTLGGLETWKYWIPTKLGSWEPGDIESRPSWGPKNLEIAVLQRFASAYRENSGQEPFLEHVPLYMAYLF